MKKKRSDNKKNGSGSNASGTGNDASSNIPNNDNHHNGATPCSNVAAAIAQEIFPTAALSLSSADRIGKDGGDGNTAEKDAAKVGKKRTMAGKNSKEEKAATEDNGPLPTTQQEDQPLLGFMIQSYLVEERKRAREEKGQNNVGSSKKKKNKKKKKKKSANTSASTDGAEEEQGATAVIACGEEGGDSNNCQTAVATEITPKHDKENSLNNAECSSAAKKPQKTSNSLPSLDSNSHSPPSPQNESKEEKISDSLSGLDCLLDSIIDSKESSSIINNEASRRGNRDIESFAAFLGRKFDSHLEQHQSQQKKDKLSKSSSSSLGSEENEKSGGVEFKDILPTISTNLAHDLTNMVDCRKCRTSAMTHLRNLTSEDPFVIARDGNTEIGSIEIEHQPINESPVFVLNEESAKITPPSGATARGSSAKGYGHSLSIPTSSMFADEFEHAFDYVSMDDVDLEAGGQDTESEKGSAEIATGKSFHMELRPISQASEKVRFLQMGPLSAVGNDVGSYPMKMQDMINLIKYVILPCGLEQGGGDVIDRPESDELSDSALADIAKEAFNLMGERQREIFHAKSTIASLKDEMENVCESNNRSVFDPKTAKILNDCDSALELVLKQIGHLLVQLLKSACFVAWSKEHGTPLLEFVLRLWSRYKDAMAVLVKPVLRQRGRVLQAAAREGLVPQAFTSRVVRDSLEDVVRFKMSTLDSLVEDFKLSLEGHPNAPSPMVQLFLLEAYRRRAEHPEVTPDSVFPDQEGEDLLIQLISAQINLSQKIVGGGLLEVVKKRVEEQREEITGLCRKMRKIIIAMEDLAPETKVQNLRRVYKDFESTWYDTEKIAKEHARETPTKATGGEMEYEVKDTILLLQKSSILVSQLFVQLTSRQCHESSMKSLTLPLSLKTWSDGVSGTELPRSMPTNDIVKQICGGDGGERRVSSIMAALLYRWLEARCSEWHAELTRDELLQSMDMEEPVVVREGGNKSGKKKKSKRKSGGGNKGKNKNVKNDSQAGDKENSSGDVAGKDTAVDVGGAKITATSSQEEKKDYSMEETAISESLTMDTESIKLVESLSTIEEIGIAFEESTTANTLEGEWKENKPKRKTGGGNKGQIKKGKNHSRNSVKQSLSGQRDLVTSPVEKKDDKVQEVAHDESKTMQSIGTEAKTHKDPEKESTLPSKGANKSSSEQPPQGEAKQVDTSSEEELDNAKCEYFPSVGIIDGKQIVAAEMYLVKRLQVITGLKGMDSTPSSKRVPIVWM